MNDDTFLEVIKHVGPKDIDALCISNKEFKEKCKVYKNLICKNVLQNFGIKDFKNVDPCELYRFMKKANPNFDNLYLFFAHAIMQNKPDYIDILNKRFDVQSDEAEDVGEWLSDVYKEYLPIDTSRSWTFKVGSEDYDFTRFVFREDSILAAIKNNKQDDVFKMLDFLQEEAIPIHHEYNTYIKAAKSNRELYNKLKQYFEDIDIYD